MGAKMESIFLRSIALGAAQDGACVTNASRRPGDGTFAIAIPNEGLIQVYAASCAALLHEFTTIHSHVHALHYTSFSDSLVTLESQKSSDRDNDSDDEAETFLCVYHDWREQSIVRGYTLPLGVLDAPSFKRKGNCVAVCSYTGRVAVAMGAVINIWQCSQGFFEHVMEVQVDMTQHDAYHVLEFVAIHGIYVAFGSSTEVRVLEVHVRSVKEQPAEGATPALRTRNVQMHEETSKSLEVPEDDPSCVHFRLDGQSDDIDTISIPLASYGDTMDEHESLCQANKMTESDFDEIPVVLGRDEAQREIHNLAGLIRSSDIRVNQAMNYYVGEDDVRVILRRYLPPNQRIQTLKFLPETIDNHISLEARSYTRLLVGTIDHAFLYYFMSSEADVTRKKMAMKVLGRSDSENNRGYQRSFSMARQSPTDRESRSTEHPFEGDYEAGRVVMHYGFANHVTNITANSSFLFAASATTIQVWSIWSPCHHLAASRTMNSHSFHEPTQPRLLCVLPLPYPVHEIASMDSYVILIPRKPQFEGCDLRNWIRKTSACAAETVPLNDPELRHSSSLLHREDDNAPGAWILQQSPPSAILSMVQATQMRLQARVDLLMSLFSLYRYRADIGRSMLTEAASPHSLYDIEPREVFALKLESMLYDQLARQCAEALAEAFLSTEMLDLHRAALFFVESSVPIEKVVATFEKHTTDRSGDTKSFDDAMHTYLEACVFQPQKDEKSRQTTDFSEGFTQLALRHYISHAPDQLTKLIVDSSLGWSLNDLHTGHLLLDAIDAPASVQLDLARLTLQLRAHVISLDVWELFYLTNPGVHDDLRESCSYEAVCSTLDKIIRTDSRALVRLCTSHPNILTQRRPCGKSSDTSSSQSSPILSQSLLDRSPRVFAETLESVFDNAIARRESVMGVVLIILESLGSSGQESRLRVQNQKPRFTIQHNDPSFSRGHCVLLRLLCYLLDQFPRLYGLAERDEINEDHEDLRQVRNLLGLELVHACVNLTSALKNVELDAKDTDILPDLFNIMSSVDRRVVPAWEIDFVESRCAAPNTPIGHVGCNVMLRVLTLLHDSSLLLAKDIVAAYELTQANDFAFLAVLLSLPRVQRTMDGLKLLSHKAAYVDLFLPYGKHFCRSLEEWKQLISTLSDLSASSAEGSEVRSSDELGVLESVLHHVCSSLSPEELLQVLPDDGDLALFVSTIEACLRWDDGRAVRSQRRRSGGLAVH